MSFARRFLLMPVLAAGFALTGCDKKSEERLDRLEAELREIRSNTRDEVAELKNRVIATETKVGVSVDDKSFSERLSLVENSMGEALHRRGGANEMVYLRPLLQGHAPLQTDHGTLLVRMEGMDLNLGGGGYTIHLNIGNPLAIAIQQFTLKGDHGGNTPDLPEGEEYSTDHPVIQAWQKTLTPFEYRVTKTLAPFSWTPFDIEIQAESREDLELIRFQMLIENAQLHRQSGDGSDSNHSFAHISVDSGAASVLRTEYGAFLILVKNAEETEVGTRLHLEIGNPYGFTLNQCRLVGDFGPALPKREESASSEEFSEKMSQWSASLQPFEAQIASKISNFRWNKASILVPGKPDTAKFLRCQLRVEDVTLPAATGQ